MPAGGSKLVETGFTNRKETVMGLWWEWSTYNLPSGKTIDDVKNLVATNPYYGLPSLGYTGIAVAADVHGVKGGVIVAVTYLPMTGSNHWQVVSCNGDKTDLDQVVGQLGILHTDYF
jgi:hypothetical protein